MAVENQEQYQLDNFSQGIDRSDDPRNIAENATPKTENTRFYGVLWTSRPGYESYLDELSATQGYDGLFGWVKNDSLGAVHGGSIYRADNSANEWVKLDTPALLVGATTAEDDFAVWAAIADGSFKITIDGTARDITAIDFTGVTTMDEVAAKLQVALRAVTSGKETIYWTGEYFTIQSGTMGGTTALSAVSAVVPASGTDLTTMMACTSAGAAITLTLGQDVDTEEYLGDLYSGNANEPFLRIQHADNDDATDNYRITAIGSAPKGDIVNSWAEKMWVCGNEEYPRTLYYSRTALADHPEYIYDFGGDGSGSELLGKKGVLTGLNNTKNAQVIFKDNETYYVRTFNTTTLAPTIDELSNDVGCVGNKAHVKVKDDVYFFTGAEVRIVTEFEGYPNLYTAAISKPIRRLIKDDLDDDQSGAVLNYNAKDNLLKLWVRSKDSVVNDTCLVYHLDDENKTWTVDRGKTASQAVTFKDKTYWGASSYGQAYLDETGLTDDGGPITSFRWSKNKKLYSAKGQKKFREYYLAGSMSDDTELIVRIYVDGRLVKEVTITSDDFTDSPEVLTGPIGTDPYGAQPVGGVLVDKKPFQKRFRFNKIGRYIETYIENSSLGGYHEVTDELFRYIPLPRSAERI